MFCHERLPFTVKERKIAMNKKMSIFTNGILKENPLLVLNIGLCSSLGITTSIFNGLGMGMGMTFVLVMSELVISIFRKHIPSAVRLPIFIVIIAAFTTIVQLVLKAYVPSLFDALGVFLPLIVVNCIIMGRVEAFASKNTVGDSVLDALGMGLGYTAVLVCISLVRELFGAGTLLDGTALKLELIPAEYRIGVLNSAPGGFIVFGCLGALVQAVRQGVAGKKSLAEKKAILDAHAEKRRIEEEKAAEEKKRLEEAKRLAAEKAAAAKSAAENPEKEGEK